MTRATQTMRRFAEIDPARELDPAPDEQLLARTLARPQGYRPTPLRAVRSHARLFAAATVTALIVAIVAVALLAAPGGPASGPVGLNLAAQAYAQTSVTSGEILYTLATTTSERPAPSGTVKREEGSIQEWHRGRETHRLERYGPETALDHVIDADGVMRQISDDGAYRIIRPSDNEDAANVIAEQQSGFVEQFRRNYEQGRLDPAGDVRFAGRPARRYVVSPQPSTDPASNGLPQPEQTFYIDRETGEPLGYTSTLMNINFSDGEGKAFPANMQYKLIVRTIKQLAPTQENLAKLHGFSLPRRRDADGCIRGPVTNARNSDTAVKSDCGGTPGAALPR